MRRNKENQEILKVSMKRDDLLRRAKDENQVQRALERRMADFGCVSSTVYDSVGWLLVDNGKS